MPNAPCGTAFFYAEYGKGQRFSEEHMAVTCDAAETLGIDDLDVTDRWERIVKELHPGEKFVTRVVVALNQAPTEVVFGRALLSERQMKRRGLSR